MGHEISLSQVLARTTSAVGLIVGGLRFMFVGAILSVFEAMAAGSGIIGLAVFFIGLVALLVPGLVMLPIARIPAAMCGASIVAIGVACFIGPAGGSVGLASLWLLYVGIALVLGHVATFAGAEPVKKEAWIWLTVWVVASGLLIFVAPILWIREAPLLALTTLSGWSWLLISLAVRLREALEKIRPAFAKAVYAEAVP